MCKFKFCLFEIIRQNIARWCQKTFYFQKFSDNAQQCYAFTPQANFPAHDLNFHWGWRIESSLPFKILSTLFWKICILFLNFFNDILPGYFSFSLDLNSTAVIYLLDGEIWMHRYSKWHLVRQWQCPHLQHLHTVRKWKILFQTSSKRISTNKLELEFFWNFLEFWQNLDASVFKVHLVHQWGNAVVLGKMYWGNALVLGRMYR